jgi:hypothetical protein
MAGRLREHDLAFPVNPPIRAKNDQSRSTSYARKTFRMDR